MPIYAKKVEHKNTIKGSTKTHQKWHNLFSVESTDFCLGIYFIQVHILTSVEKKEQNGKRKQALFDFSRKLHIVMKE